MLTSCESRVYTDFNLVLEGRAGVRLLHAWGDPRYGWFIGWVRRAPNTAWRVSKITRKGQFMHTGIA